MRQVNKNMAEKTDYTTGRGFDRLSLTQVEQK